MDGSQEQQTIVWRLPGRPEVPPADARVEVASARVSIRECDVDTAVHEAGALLQRGKLVAFPTETVYGLGAVIGDDRALGRIYTAKGRPSDNPLIVHVCTVEQVFSLAEAVDPLALALMKRFWPGPLSILLPARSSVSSIVTAGLPTVAVRMPSHPLALALIRAAGQPLAAPSANRSGRPSPTSAAHVIEDLGGMIAGVLDGGRCDVGIESTVVSVEDGVVTILRPGIVSLEDLRTVAETVVYDPGSTMLEEGAIPRSPGQKYRHYAPTGALLIVQDDQDGHRAQSWIAGAVAEARAAGKRVGVLTVDRAFVPAADLVLHLGDRARPDLIAQSLYDALRTCDAHALSVIYAESLPKGDRMTAVANRLYKAAGGNYLTV